MSFPPLGCHTCGDSLQVFFVADRSLIAPMSVDTSQGLLIGNPSFQSPSHP